MSTTGFYRRHLKNVAYSPQAFAENFLNSFFTVVSLEQKYMYKANYGNNIRIKGNSNTYKCQQVQV
jgi:hypothetical protein